MSKGILKFNLPEEQNERQAMTQSDEDQKAANYWVECKAQATRRDWGSGDHQSYDAFLAGSKFGRSAALKECLETLRSDEARKQLTQFESDTLADFLEKKMREREGR